MNWNRKPNVVLTIVGGKVHIERMVALILSQNVTANLYLVLAMFVLDIYKKEPLKVK